MKLATIQKLGGFSLIAGAILFATYSVLFLSLFPADEIHRDFSRIVLSPPWIGVAGIAFAGVVLMVFGFAAVYSRLHQGAGALGLVGFVFIEVAYLLQACKVTWEIFLYPIIAGNPSSVTLLRDGILRDHPLVHAFKAGASATIFFGILLFCFALVRSKEFQYPFGHQRLVGEGRLRAVSGHAEADLPGSQFLGAAGRGVRGGRRGRETQGVRCAPQRAVQLVPVVAVPAAGREGGAAAA